MLRNQGHILTDDIVVNYRNTDRDDCLHFLTHLDTSCKDLAMFISPTAKRIYTSVFNSWYLKSNFNVKNIDIQGFDTNKSFKITFKGNKYIYSFLDSKFTTGSVSLLLHGPFGTYLYTGNFCYYPSFVRSPVLLPVIEEKALTRLYLDNTYYEQPSNFLGFDELAGRAATIIKSLQKKNIYIYADKVTMDPLLAEIASKLEEKVYVCQNTMEIMKILGYEPYFTQNANESRIFVEKAYIQKKGYGDDNIIMYFNRYTDTCRNFKKYEKKGNIHNFYFYCHSNHKEICDLLTMLKPESMTFLFSEIDKSKISYNFNFNPQMPTIFKSFSEKPMINPLKAAGVHKPIKIVPKYNRSGSSKTIDSHKDVEISEMNVQTIQEIQDLNFSGLSKENKCPLRIRKVPEINRTGLCNVYNPLMEESSMHVQNVTSSHEESNYTSNNILSNEEQSTDTNSVSTNVHVDLMTRNLHNYCKPTANDTSVEVSNLLHVANTSFSRTGILNSRAFARKTAPLVMNRKLVNNSALTSNQNYKRNGFISPIKTTVYQKRCIDTKSKFDYSENGKHLTHTKKSGSLLAKSKLDDPPPKNKKRYNALCKPPNSNDIKLSTLFQEWMDKSSILGLPISPPILETINNNHKNPKTYDSLKNSETLLIPIQSGSCERDVGLSTEIDFETNVVNENRDVSDSNIDYQQNSGLDHDNSQTTEMRDEISLHDDTLISVIGNNDSTTTMKTKSVTQDTSTASTDNHTKLAVPSCVAESEHNYTELVESSCVAGSEDSNHTDLVVSSCVADSGPNLTELVVSSCLTESEDNHTGLMASSCITKSEDNHTGSVVSSCVTESEDNHTGSVVSSCVTESEDNHTGLMASSCVTESEDNHTGLMASSFVTESEDNHTGSVVSSCVAESELNHTELVVSSCLTESEDNHTGLMASSCVTESEDNHTGSVVSSCVTESEDNHTGSVVSSCVTESEDNHTGLVESSCEAESEDDSSHTDLLVSSRVAESEENCTELVGSSCIADSEHNHTELVISSCVAESEHNHTELVVSSCVDVSEHNQTELVMSSCVAESEQTNTNNEKTNETYEQDHEKNYSNNGNNGCNNLKRTLLVTEFSGETVTTRKKLRSETRLGSLQPSIIKESERVNLKDCCVLLKRNDIDKAYFFSSQLNCHLPKFGGFKRHQVRPRHMLLNLRSIQKCIEKLPLF